MTCDQKRFERDVANHKMTVVRDDGVDRHIKFRAADGDSSYWFEILTWPGALCIRGDCGTYVFSRLTDMFQFFRTDRGNDPKKLYVNEGYWAEKLQAVSCDGYGKGAAERFSASQFKARVKDRVDSCLEGYETTAEQRADLWQEINDEIFDYVEDGHGGEAFRHMHDFESKDFPRLFEDCWEWNCNEYTFHFLWNLYAIAWAIRQYDAARVPTEQPA
ncbi:Phage protein [Caballeronia glathei]|uniref:Uncharacterized protein n=1 Tax=Caballeronia glathei TaxID=60547 RepID=A0A069PW38_9BURK|nr:hypothetical protein [Caballeronia glathei]KDR41571.1 hypothetical protein BG61_17020 [Caballeronia glathei]CDY79424.1 Phage protein [Caballeronia glathei]